MAKKTKASTEGKISKKGRRGPLKQKVRLTVRFDKDLMDQAYAIAKETSTRLTDLLERGMLLACKEVNQDLPLVYQRVRFLVANASANQQEQVLHFMMFLVAPYLRPLSPTDKAVYKFILGYLKTMAGWENLRRDTMKLFSVFGQPPEVARVLNEIFPAQSGLNKS